MRHLSFAAAIAAAQIAAFPALAEPCARAPEWAALNMAGLKSQMMVVALTCDLRDKYNVVINRFKPELANSERGLRGYFIRAYGRRAQQSQDDYTTNLANSQSELGIKQGTLFCRQNGGLFDDIMKLPAAAPLTPYAASKGYTQPIPVASCDAPKTPIMTASASLPRPVTAAAAPTSTATTTASAAVPPAAAAKPPVTATAAVTKAPSGAPDPMLAGGKSH